MADDSEGELTRQGGSLESANVLPAGSLADVLNASTSAEHAIDCLVEAFPHITLSDLFAAIEVEVLELAWDEHPHQGTFRRTIEVLLHLLWNHERDSEATPLRKTVRRTGGSGAVAAESAAATPLDSSDGDA